MNYKRMFVSFMLIGVIIIPGFAQTKKKLVIGEQPVFQVHKTNKTIVVDGKMNEKEWSKTEARNLNYFYKTEKADDSQNSVFRMLWDDTHLYVFFQAEDKYITARERNRDGQPYFDDCAELFLIPVPDSLDMHIGFELNLYKASNDFIYFNNMYNNQHGIMKQYNPDFDVEVSINGTLNDNSDIDKGWTMELAIPLSNFTGVDTFFPVEEGNKWAFLAIRQDRNDAEGNRRSTSTIFPIYEIEKNVHQPKRFGLMEFVK